MAVSREKKTQQDAAPEPYDKVVERLEKLVEELEGEGSRSSSRLRPSPRA